MCASRLETRRPSRPAVASTLAAGWVGGGEVSGTALNEPHARATGQGGTGEAASTIVRSRFSHLLARQSAAGQIARRARALLTNKSAAGETHHPELATPRRPGWSPLSWQRVRISSIEAVCSTAAAGQTTHREGLWRSSTRERERKLSHELRDCSTYAYKGARALVGRVRADARIGWAHSLVER